MELRFPVLRLLVFPRSQEPLAGHFSWNAGLSPAQDRGGTTGCKLECKPREPTVCPLLYPQTAPASCAWVSVLKGPHVWFNVAILKFLIIVEQGAHKICNQFCSQITTFAVATRSTSRVPHLNSYSSPCPYAPGKGYWKDYLQVSWN